MKNGKYIWKDMRKQNERNVQGSDEERSTWIEVGRQKGQKAKGVVFDALMPSSLSIYLMQKSWTC
jgi:hypothetical protein